MCHYNIHKFLYKPYKSNYLEWKCINHIVIFIDFLSVCLFNFRNKKFVLRYPAFMKFHVFTHTVMWGKKSTIYGNCWLS